MTNSGGAFWTNLSSSYVSWRKYTEEHGDQPYVGYKGDIKPIKWSPTDTFIFDFSDQCYGRELLLVTPPWQTESENFTARAELCSPVYYGATVPVTASVSKSITHIDFDREEFARRRKPISNNSLDLERLNDLAFGDVWQKYHSVSIDLITNEKRLSPQGFEGAPGILAEFYSLNYTTMLKDVTLPQQANKLRSRFFSEVIMSSAAGSEAAILAPVIGRQSVAEKRVMVVIEVGVTLSILFLLATSYLLCMLWWASLRHRPLGLGTDPATAIGIASILQIKSTLAITLRALKEGRMTDTETVIGSSTYSLRDGFLAESTTGDERLTVNKTKVGVRKDWRPSMLQKRWLATLLLGLLAVAATLIVLRGLASKQQLYRSAFVYQIDLGAFNTNFAPHSLVPALVAVIIGLCWGSIDVPMRTLQPYLAMSKGRSNVPTGISLSYQSVYWVWSAVKAARCKHWILLLVSIGTVLSQVFVVSMSAIFERQAGTHTQIVSVDCLFELRQQLFAYDPQWSPFFLSESVVDIHHADWMYTALDEIVLGIKPPIWTKDRWAFAPVDLDNLAPDSVRQRIGDVSDQEEDSGFITSSANVSLITSALQARLECSVIPLAGTSWLQRIEDEYPKSWGENTTGHLLPMMLFSDTPHNTSVYSAPRRIACCTNGTIQGGQSAVAHWSSNNPYNENPYFDPKTTSPMRTQYWPNGWPGGIRDADSWTRNFTIKWIVGPAATVSMPDNGEDMPMLYFIEAPKMQIMNCKPLIEQADASIVVDRATGYVLDAKIIGNPLVVSEPWEKAYNPIGNTTENTTREVRYVHQRTRSNFILYWLRYLLFLLKYIRLTTYSFGNFFMSQMLTAAHIINHIDTGDLASSAVANNAKEDLEIERFNIRDQKKGYNMDFMSYTNFVLAGNDPLVLLDADQLLNHSQYTFQTFFKHFARSGKWDNESAAYQSLNGSNAEKVDVTLSTRISLLTMNETATWLSLSILFIIIIIVIILIVVLQIVYPSSCMVWNVECLADVLLMIAGSDNLVSLVHEKGLEGLRKSDVETRLGWFRDKRGVLRWGIELVDAEGVSWVEKPEHVLTVESSA